MSDLEDKVELSITVALLVSWVLTLLAGFAGDWPLLVAGAISQIVPMLLMSGNNK